MGDPTNYSDPVDREERRDDEEMDEFFSTTWKANVKLAYDLDRRHHSAEERAFLREQLADLSQERRQREEEHDMRMRHKEEQFTLRTRGSEQSIAHRDLAIAQQWRDQARDSGESAFVPKQSS